MMKKLTYTILALVLLAACGGDFAEMDIGLDGNWIDQSGTELYINGMGYTRTTVNGDVETGTIGAAGGYITFSRIGQSSETKKYTLNFPELKIGEITYYYNSPSEPVDIAGTWFAWAGMSPSLTFSPGKPVKDENKKDTPAREGDFSWYGYYKGKYTISNRNLPNNSILVLSTTHIHVKNLWHLVFADPDLPLDIQELFDHSLLEIPSTFEGLEDWWFTINEVRSFFHEAADRTNDLVKKDDVYLLMNWFLEDYKLEGTYAYVTVYDPDIPNNEFIEMRPGVHNKLTITRNGSAERFVKAKEGMLDNLD
jgi:hypothetical protein